MKEEKKTPPLTYDFVQSDLKTKLKSTTTIKRERRIFKPKNEGKSFKEGFIFLCQSSSFLLLFSSVDSKKFLKKQSTPTHTKYINER